MNLRTRPTSPRIAPLTDAEIGPAAKEILDTVVPAGTSPGNLFRTIVRNEGLTRRWLPFGSKVLRAGKLPERDREFLVLRTGWNCQSAYEWGQHVAISLDIGITQDEIDRIAAGPDAGWVGFEKALITAADELHFDACISEETWAVLAERYDVQQLIELPMLVGQYHLVAMTLNSLGIPLDPGARGFGP